MSDPQKIVLVDVGRKSDVSQAKSLGAHLAVLYWPPLYGDDAQFCHVFVLDDGLLAKLESFGPPLAKVGPTREGIACFLLAGLDLVSVVELLRKRVITCRDIVYTNLPSLKSRAEVAQVWAGV